VQDEPHPPEILQAVAAFLRDVVVPATEGSVAYQARVAAAALNLVRREIMRTSEDEAERGRLCALLGQDGTLAALNAELARRLADGKLDLASPGVAAHLWVATREKLAVDQPRYWGLQAAGKDKAS
jgi:hypothetical protein